MNPKAEYTRQLLYTFNYGCVQYNKSSSKYANNVSFIRWFEILYRIETGAWNLVAI